MVDLNMKTVTNQIDSTPAGLGQQPPSDSVLHKTTKTFKDIQKAILAVVNDPQIDPMHQSAQSATIDTLLHQLRTAINEENSKTTQEIKDNKDIITH
jgi:hypothetical protein